MNDLLRNQWFSLSAEGCLEPHQTPMVGVNAANFFHKKALVVDDDDDDDDDDDEHFYSLRTRFYKVIYIYNRIFTPLTHFNK